MMPVLTHQMDWNVMAHVLWNMMSVVYVVAMAQVQHLEV
jgi:hypothetical protein